jgi:hypothetical protein
MKPTITVSIQYRRAVGLGGELDGDGVAFRR